MQTATESQPPWAPGDVENKGTVHTAPSNEGRRMLNVKPGGVRNGVAKHAGSKSQFAYLHSAH